eukprot:CAMPEP_0172547146 /NCGR_PEP_ID=MMETSP1067-20121228/16745_1 /TAXON_ID=265564 ORGANISM="Thalassiosira punctigera, Strain Tpunct2005C2" /NCGR_SAMPLE_ID=MMETSP1067 /ASSEMBLY_ACC=CAM_ASM_000444 /LENGTH=40 /DNA_ID= /DNA_START= /DNA_END= /DNA_ORIENTATION=
MRSRRQGHDQEAKTMSNPMSQDRDSEESTSRSPVEDGGAA